MPEEALEPKLQAQEAVPGVLDLLGSMQALVRVPKVQVVRVLQTLAVLQDQVAQT